MIAFTAPWVLGGLVLAAVPIVLHLVARREPPVVEFPAVRYLEETSRRHQRRVHLQHWMLLLVRTLLIVLLVLAAAGPTREGGVELGGHSPTALVIILDNSLSSGAVRGGEPTLSQLRAAAAATLERATPADRLWLVTADGVPRSGSAEVLRAVVDSIEASEWRLDLGAALTVSQALLATTSLPGEVVMLTDLQATAVSPASGDFPIVIGIPETEAPANLGIARLDAGAQPWLGAGRLSVEVHGEAGSDPRPLRVALAGREVRQVLVDAGARTAIPVAAPLVGWHRLEVRLDPDELRGDDGAVTAVRQAAPASVAWESADRYVDAAMEVLVANGRIVRGGEVTIGRFGSGSSIILPPADAAELGALNRTLAARGIGWAFAESASPAGRTDSSTTLPAVVVARRHRLLPVGSGVTGVIATVDGEPWLVRSGNVVVFGSRLDPEWTDLPLTAGYMPFMDALVNRYVRGELATLQAAPGDLVALPGGVTRVLGPLGDQRVESGGRYLATVTGLHWLVEASDTVGVLAVNPDPRESALAAATPAAVRALWPGARLLSPEGAATLAFGQGARADLRGPFLWLVLLLACCELLLGAALRRRSG
ncbi:MAG TPA: BatA domain-containing protein [Gemmatimonadales bacterium]|nr:BatA domain-containing protein [Gemmatimonadales bacterium]